jgi:hypothetical protein
MSSAAQKLGLSIKAPFRKEASPLSPDIKSPISWILPELGSPRSPASPSLEMMLPRPVSPDFLQRDLNGQFPIEKNSKPLSSQSARELRAYYSYLKRSPAKNKEEQISALLPLLVTAVLNQTRSRESFNDCLKQVIEAGNDELYDQMMQHAPQRLKKEDDAAKIVMLYNIARSGTPHMLEDAIKRVDAKLLLAAKPALTALVRQADLEDKPQMLKLLSTVHSSAKTVT